jgi:MFS transporter, DHA2 family, lincomycin resistance protein
MTQENPSGGKRGSVLLALFIGGSISLLSETIINVALTSFMKEFNVPASSVQWLSTGYMLILGILVPVTAFLLEWLSTKQVFLGALIVFTIGSIVAGMASSFPALLAGRLIQAVGTGPMVPLMVNTTLLVTPREKHGSAMGLCQLVILTAPALAPTLAGVLVEYVSWRWLFFFVLPFTVLAAAIAIRFLDVPRELKRPALDLPSVAFSTLGFGAFIYGVSVAGSGGLAVAAPPLAVGIIALALFVRREISVPNPMLNLAPFKNPQFRLGMIIVMVLMMGYFASILMLPMYLQTALLLSPFVTGLVMLPGGLLNGIGSPFAGKLYDRHGPRAIVPLGIGIMAAGLLVMSLVVRGATSALPAVIVYAVILFGLPLAMTPIQTNSLSGLAAEFYSHGTVIQNTLQMIASSLGSSLFIGIMSARQESAIASGSQPARALESGLGYAFAIGAAVMAAAFIAAQFIRGSKTASVCEGSKLLVPDRAED